MNRDSDRGEMASSLTTAAASLVLGDAHPNCWVCHLLSIDEVSLHTGLLDTVSSQSWHPTLLEEGLPPTSS